MIDKSKFAGHTPGPWELIRNAEPNYDYIKSPNGLCVAALCHEGPPAVHIELLANAALMATAPELLKSHDDLVAALEACLPFYQLAHGADSDMYKEKVATLARARGKVD